MNLYRISQDVNSGYDTFDSAVVAAESEHDAARTFPQREYDIGEILIGVRDGKFHAIEVYGAPAEEDDNWALSKWCHDVSDVKVELIGVARDGIKAGVVLASFNAG